VSGCDAYFQDAVALETGELRVYRCDWGWCVMKGGAAGRSRYLDEAFELALGHKLDAEATRALIEMLDHELTARREKEQRTVSAEVAIPDTHAIQ
jgi:hypothetical protein